MAEYGLIRRDSNIVIGRVTGNHYVRIFRDGMTIYIRPEGDM